MPILPSSVMARAELLLGDTLNVRWTAAEMGIWLQDALTAIANAKPSAFTARIEHDLVEGSRQTLPATASGLLRVLNNTSGMSVSTVERSILDDVMPGWEDVTMYPATAVVQHACYDPADPLHFDVFPANDGNGSINLLVTAIPAEITAGAADIASWDTPIALDASYSNALRDYVVAMAYASDQDDPTAQANHQRHMGMFQTAIGLKTAVETTITPDTQDQLGA